MITSTQHPKIKAIRKMLEQPKQRVAQAAFAVEGVRLAEEALQAGWPARYLVYSEELNPRGRLVVEGYQKAGTQIELVSPHVMHHLSETETSQGILVVLEAQSLPIPKRIDFGLILDEIRDPGNLGSILRTALAAGVQAVFLTPTTTDPLSPKVIRASMGAHFRIPVKKLGWDDLKLLLQKRGEVRLFLATVGEGKIYDQVDFRGPLMVLIGGEAFGASQQALLLPHQDVHIPMPGGTESLNTAVAAGILLFEVIRQRRLSI